MLTRGSGCKYRFSLAERSDCTETIINQLLADSYQNPISEQQVTIKLHLTEQTGHKQHTSGVTVSHHSQMGPSSCGKTSSGLPLILHYGELHNYFIIQYSVIVIEIKRAINVMHLNHPETIPPHHPTRSEEKSSSMKPVPGAKKVGDRCYTSQQTGNLKNLVNGFIVLMCHLVVRHAHSNCILFGFFSYKCEYPFSFKRMACLLKAPSKGQL